VVLDRTFPTERTVRFEIKEGELYTDSEHENEVYNHISYVKLKRTVRTLAIDVPCFKLGIVIIRRN
jgi:hypothetical protein